DTASRVPNFACVHPRGLGLAYVGHEPLPEPLQTLLTRVPMQHLLACGPTFPGLGHQFWSDSGDARRSDSLPRPMLRPPLNRGNLSGHMPTSRISTNS